MVEQSALYTPGHIVNPTVSVCGDISVPLLLTSHFPLIGLYCLQSTQTNLARCLHCLLFLLCRFQMEY